MRNKDEMAQAIDAAISEELQPLIHSDPNVQSKVRIIIIYKRYLVSSKREPLRLLDIASKTCFI